MPSACGDLFLRMIRPDDKPLILDGFARLSDESRWLRFLGARQSLSASDLKYLTEIDGENHVAIGALSSSGQPVGVARLVRFRHEARVAEIAVTVLDAYQGRGVGHILLSRLADAARERGISTFRVETSVDNGAMQRLAHTISNDVQTVSSVGGVATIVIRL